MKLLSLLLFLLGLALASCNLTQFGQLIKKQTGKSPLAYIGYGCCCVLGSKEPLDATDRCCHAHHCCYKKLVSSGCSPKTATYQYAFRGDVMMCGTGDWCTRETCGCDKKAVECFQSAASTYHKSYENYPRSKCKGRAPSC